MSTATTRRPATVDDLRMLRFIEGHAVSPDGSLVAAVVSAVDGPEDRYRCGIWIVSTAGGAARQVTFGVGNGDSKPAFSPAGDRLAFVSDRGAGPQLFVLDLAGGEALPLPAVPGGVFGYVWAPDGRRLAVVSTGVAADSARPASRRIDRLHYKGDGVGLLADDTTHLFLLDSAR